MFKILNLDSPLDLSKLTDVRFASIGQCEQAIRAMLASVDAFSARFTLDGAGKQAMLQAFGKVAGLPKDKTVAFTQVAVTVDGKVMWKRLKKGESAGKRETREATIRSYSRDACQQARESVRTSHGVAWLEDPTVSSPNAGETVYVLARETSTSDAS